jgi:diguanylate cyclase (GGDEF)-like protein
VDILARYGGEEFVILLPEVCAKDAASVAERLRQEIERARFPTKAGFLGVTISLGVAEFTPDMVLLSDLLEEANQVEHLAKQTGRNRVVVANSALVEDTSQ